MRITIAQLCVERDIVQNKEKMLSVLRSAHPGDWITFPEGVLTGYFPEEEGFLRDIDSNEVEKTIQEIGQEAQHSQCHCIFGTATFANGSWHNSVIIQDPLGKSYIYHKIQLSNLDKRHFTPGNNVSIYSISGINIGIQVCRELIFPEPWTRLKKAGAQIVFHINNAIKPHDKIWNHILITRAIENSFFVCSINNAAPPQQLTSYLIDPSGKVLLEADRQVEQILTHEINLSEVIANLEERRDF